MALETATLISDLSTSNPTSGDPKSQGDDHLRLIKTVLQNQFPDASAGPIYGLRSVNCKSLTGASVDFTSIPSWVRRIAILVSSMSTNGTSNPLFQIGTSSGVEVTGYLGSGTTVTGATPSSGSFTTGFGLNLGSASNVIHGSLILSLIDSGTNSWVASGTFGRSDAASNQMVGGSKALAGTLDRVRITTVGGTDTFDSGIVNILYE